MSIHGSLRTKGALTKHRNVLSRMERLKRLEDEGRWLEDKNSVLGLPKVKNIKLRAKKKAKEAAPEEGAALAPAIGAPPVPGAAAAPAAGAPAAKGAAPAPAAKAGPVAKSGSAKK